MTMRTISPVPLEEQYSCLLLLYHILCSLARRVRANCQHMLHPRINAALPSSSYDPLTTDNSPKILLCPIPYSSAPATYPLSALSHLVGDTRSHQRCSFLIPPMLLTSRLSTLVRRCAFCPIQCSNDRKKIPVTLKRCMTVFSGLSMTHSNLNRPISHRGIHHMKCNFPQHTCGYEGYDRGSLFTTNAVKWQYVLSQC